jgi:NADH dehydrogenase (ubiquinone) 1 alpha subcomplex subunit 8
MAPATSSELYASAAIMAKNCNASNKAYLLCKTASPNPGSCLEEGSAVTACGDGLIAKLKSSCSPEFEAFRACLADTNNAFDKCKAQKEALYAAFNFKP